MRLIHFDNRLWYLILRLLKTFYCIVGDTMVGLNSTIQRSSRLDEMTIESNGFCPMSIKCLHDPLHSDQFDMAIVGSRHSFSSVDSFRDVVYLLSLVGRFRVKFKRNCAKH